MKKSTLVYWILFLLIILLVFKSWFLPGLVNSGDWVYYFPQEVTDTHFLAAWDFRHNGLGASVLPTLWLEMYFTATMKSSLFLGWALYEKLFWFLPFLVFSIFSSFFLAKKLFKNTLTALFSSFIYTLNTYTLLVIGGGQLELAYAFVPFVLLAFMTLTDTVSFKNSLLFGFVFAVDMLFDIRFAYIAASAIFLYFIFFIANQFDYFKKNWVPCLLLCIALPAGEAILLNAYWILPILFTGHDSLNQLGSAYTSLNAVVYFSFAKFENSFSLLHPYWPENIFGFVHFMRPEFLFIPILAYSSLLFLPVREKNTMPDLTSKNQKVAKSIDPKSISANCIIYFALLGLLGAFLAKGANDPFGGIYLWLFSHIPGFFMFRDPTKWYALIALSYSILIPFAVWQLYLVLKKRSIFLTKYIPKIFLVLIISYFLFLIRPALFGQLNGNYKFTTVPPEYVSLANYLINQDKFSRTLWVPGVQRFGLNSQNHPALAAQDLFGIYNQTMLLNKLSEPKTESLLQEMSIGYVIVPTDSQGEIFIQNNTYSETVYRKTVAGVAKIPWLTPIRTINNLVLYQVPDPKDHFWSTDKTIAIQYSPNSPTRYIVTIKNAKKNDLLIFSESYDPFWIAQVNTFRVKSEPFHSVLNSFVLPQNGNYSMEITYVPQYLVYDGAFISVLSLVSILLYLFQSRLPLIRLKGKKKK